MPSFNVVNYSLRPNKAIQRSIVFGGLQVLQQQLEIHDPVYIGFGSIWFTDFTIAHKTLNAGPMISIEADDIGWKRAEFNRPYRTVRVEHGISTDILARLAQDGNLRVKPWIVWLDYDGCLDESVVEDLRFVIERAPPNSALLTTFNATGRNYGKHKHRSERIRTLLGDVVPDELSADQCADEAIASTLARYVTDFMISSALGISRSGGFEPAFELLYRDGASMVTVGGMLPTKDGVQRTRECVADQNWEGKPTLPIKTPLLTVKEAAVLQAQLPRSEPLTRDSVLDLGFDLEDEQIRAFETFYKYYPSFAEISI